MSVGRYVGQKVPRLERMLVKAGMDVGSRGGRYQRL